ncbi:hypothetical protein D3C78_1244680 [compost metagenome]
MQDVHISQVFQRRLVDAGIVVLGAVEAEQDVVEGPAVLVERRELREGIAILCVDTLEIPAFDQQKHPVLGISGAFQAVRAECRHALEQTDVDQTLHTIDHLLIPVDDRLGVVVMDQGTPTLHVRH